MQSVRPPIQPLDRNSRRLSLSYLRTFIAVVILFGSATLAAQSSSRELLVAAASDLNFALRELATGFERQTRLTVKLTFGSSGNLFSQVRNGAPYDVFMSADVDFPRRLVEERQAVAGTMFVYGIGRLVLWVPENSGLDIEGAGMHVLLDESVEKIAIANPRHAPYGRAAEVALRNAGLYDKVAAKLVVGENIAQAAQFVESGSAQAGLIAHSLAISPAMKGRGRWVAVPDHLYPALRQAAVLLKRARENAAARTFLDYLRSENARAVLNKYGFLLPESAQR